MTRVAVIGAKGRLGTVACQAIGADPELDLVAEVSSGDSLEDVLDAGADVAVEVTTPDSVRSNTAWLLQRGVHVVVGASGLGADDLDELADLTGSASCLVVPNFAIGAVLMMRFAAEAARWLPDAEIVELHHDQKVDAPSGTARRTAELIASARGPHHGAPANAAARGEQVDGVSVHSVRLRGLVAHQEVVFGGEGQVLTIRHDSLDRASFGPGIALAARGVASLDGLVVGLDALLR